MRTLDFTDGFTTETEPSGESFKTRGLKNYATEAAFVTAKGSAAASGDAFYDSTENVVKYHNGTSWQVMGTDGDLDTHVADTANPHSVTKTQVGLGNVDNTSDVDKPVSTAQQTALDGKTDKSTLTAKGSIYAASAASTPAEVPVGSDGQVLKADSSAASGVVWGSIASGGLTFTSETGDFTAVAGSVHQIDSSSAAVTVTLPAAADNSGLTIRLKKTSTDFNEITIGSTAIHTEGETLVLGSDGTNWVEIDRIIPSKWNAFVGSSTFTNSATEGFWRRVGDSVVVRYEITFSGTPATASLFIDLPTGLVMDTTMLPANYDDTGKFAQLGWGGAFDSGIANFDISLMYYTSTQFRVFYGTFTSPGTRTDDALTFSQPAVWVSGDVIKATTEMIPVVGWNS